MAGIDPVWKQLDELKTFRERERFKALQQRRVEEAAAQAQVEAAQQRLESHRAHAVEHERALYSELFKRPALQRAFEELLQDMAALRHQEQALELDAATCRQAHAEAERCTAEAVVAHKHAERVCCKFVELMAMFDEEATREASEREEAEIEETASIRRGDDETMAEEAEA
jgi:hypothetical protein